MSEESPTDPPTPPAAPGLLDEAPAVNELETAVLAPLRSVVRGQERVLRQMVVTLLARGHALIEGVPGTAKTLAVRALARCLSLQFGRVQFTPDLMPTDLMGVSLLDASRASFTFKMDGPSGKVTSVGSTYLSSSFRACAKAIYQKATFPKVQQSSYGVTYSLDV